MSSVMNGESLLRHMKIVRAAGYPPTETQRAIELIVQYASGNEAEGALSELLDKLPSEKVSNLVDVYLSPGTKTQGRGKARESNWLEDSAGLSEALEKRNIKVVEGADRWELTLPDRSKLVQQFSKAEPSKPSSAATPDRGEALARIGLKAAWMTRLRAKPAMTTLNV